MSFLKSIGKIFGAGGGGSPGPKLDMTKFDYAKQVDERTKQSRDASLGLISQLQQQAAGKGPSLADAQLKAASNRNLSQMMAAAAASRGGNAALQNRQLLMQQGQVGREVAEQSAIDRMKEQQAAQGLLSQHALGQQSTDTSQIMQPGQLLANAEQARFEGDVARRNAVKSQQNQMLGGLMSAGATLGAAAISDEKQKKDIKPADKKISGFLDALSAKSYSYKDSSLPGAASGERTGVLAQDLEKSEAGKELVIETSQGKMVDTQQGFGTVLAAQAELNKRLKALESRKK